MTEVATFDHFNRFSVFLAKFFFQGPVVRFRQTVTDCLLFFEVGFARESLPADGRSELGNLRRL